MIEKNRCKVCEILAYGYEGHMCGKCVLEQCLKDLRLQSEKNENNL